MNTRPFRIAVVCMTLMVASRWAAGAAGEKPPRPKELLASALTAARSIGDVDERDDALMLIIYGHSAIGDVDSAEQTAKAIGTELKQGFARRVIAGMYARRGDFKTATALAEKATGDSKSGIWGEIVAAQLERGDLAGAKLTRAKVDDTFYASQADCRIALAQATSEDLTAARQTLARVRDPSARVRGYLDVAEALLKVKDLTGARDMIGRAIKASKDVPSYFHALSIAAIARTQVKAGSLRTALSTANRIPLPSDREVVLSKIAETQVEMGDLDGGMASARLLTDGNDRVRLQALFAPAQAKGGDVAGARKSIAAARALADTIDVPTLRAFAYQSLMEAQVAMGDAGEAAAIALAQKDPIVKSYSLVAIVRAMAKK
jgi:hypothetical protein